MDSGHPRDPADAPHAVPWPWRALSALLLALTSALLLQVIPLPVIARVIAVAVLVIGAVAVDIVARTRATHGGPQRSFLQLIASTVLPLLIGTLLIVASPVTGALGVVISLALGGLAFLGLQWGQHNQTRDAQKTAAPRGPEDLTRTAIADRGGDHHPRPDTDPAARQDPGAGS